MGAHKLAAFHNHTHVELSPAGELTIRQAGQRVELGPAATAAIVAALGAPHWRPRLAELLTGATPAGRCAIVPIAPISPEALSI